MSVLVSPPTPSPAGLVLVAAGVLIEHGRVLVTQRKAGVHLAGVWELPGGKIEQGEDPRAALRRELREELGIDVAVGSPCEVTFFRYDTHAVLLLFFDVTRLADSPDPRAIEVADLKWATAGDLASLEFPPADADVVALIHRRLG